MKVLIIALTLGTSLQALAVDIKVIETIALEARGEPLEGQIAVASVIKTRAVIRNKTPLEIVLEKDQFSCNRNGARFSPLTGTDIQRAWKAWELASVGAANHYYAPAKIEPKWSRHMKIIRVIGGHVMLDDGKCARLKVLRESELENVEIK